MEIIELDLLDGKGLIPVAVAGHIESIRIRQFMSEKQDVSKQLKTRLSIRADWLQKEINYGGSYEHLSVRREELLYIINSI